MSRSSTIPVIPTFGLALLLGACATSGPVEPDPALALLATTWRLVEMDGMLALADVEATLAFHEPGRAAGRGSCNPFSAHVTLTDATIAFGPIAATRMACPDPVGAQEHAYFAALERVERVDRDGDVLVLSSGDGVVLRFTRME